MKVENSRTAAEASGARNATFQSLLLDRGVYGARFRLGLLLTFFSILWFGFALLADFPQVLPDSVFQTLPLLPAVVLDVITSFLAPKILVYLLPVLGAAWAGLLLGAAYLADLYELGDTRIATRYLMGSIFGLRYPVLTINSGEIESLDENNPLLRIGGPGYLELHLGFAAVFETSEGFPRIYGPPRKSETHRRVFIHGFERIRDVLDLRDQLRQIDEIPAVTRDGVQVYARDVQMVFRVYGGEKRSIEVPYPYDPKSVLSLVYGQVVTEHGPTRWTQTLPGLARRELQEFVSQKTLTEFLAVQPDLTRAPFETREDSPGEATLSDEDRRLSSRTRLTESFHTPERQRRLREQGLELVWVGVGTWEVRDDQIPETEEEIAAARTITAAARSQSKLERIRSQEHLLVEKRLNASKLTQRVFQDLVETWTHSELPSEYQCYEMLQRFRSQLELFQNRIHEFKRIDPDRSDRIHLPERFQIVLDHLNALTAISE